MKKSSPAVGIQSLVVRNNFGYPPSYNKPPPNSMGLLGFPPMFMPGFTCVARFSWRGGLAAAIHGTTQPHTWQLIGAGCWPRHLGFPQHDLLPSSMLDWLLYAVLSMGASPSAQTLIRPLLVPCLPMYHWPELVSRPSPESTW